MSGSRIKEIRTVQNKQPRYGAQLKHAATSGILSGIGMGIVSWLMKKQAESQQEEEVKKYQEEMRQRAMNASPGHYESMEAFKLRRYP